MGRPPPFPRLLAAPFRRAAVVALLVGLAATGRTEPTPGRADRPTDYDVVAAYLPVLLRYVVWPEDNLAADEPLRIGVLGKDPFGPALDRALAGKTIGGRRLEAVRAAAAEPLRACQLVFVNPAVPAGLPAALQPFAGRPVLTVIYPGNRPVPAGTTAAITFVLKGTNIRYALDSAALAAQGLRPTPGLLENALRAPEPAPDKAMP